MKNKDLILKLINLKKLTHDIEKTSLIFYNSLIPLITENKKLNDHQMKKIINLIDDQLLLSSILPKTYVNELISEKKLLEHLILTSDDTVFEDAKKRLKQFEERLSSFGSYKQNNFLFDD